MQGGEMKTKSVLSMLVVSLLLAMAAAGCQAAQEPAEPTSQPQEQVDQGQVETKSEYVAGVEATFPPWAWVEEGEFKGIAVDAVRAVAENEGLNITFQEMPWPSLIPALVDGKIDLIVTAVSVTEDRAEVLDYTVPWWEINRVVLVKKDSTLDGVTALCCGVTVGGQGGSTDFEWVKTELATNPGLDIDVREFEDPVTAVEDLKVGRVDSVVVDSDTGAQLAAEHTDIRIAAQFYTYPPEPYAIPVTKGDPEQLLPRLNQGIVDLYETGKWAEIVHTYIPGATILPVPAYMPDYVDSYQQPIPGLGE
jgi:polar amino acid transport system substrate-binding protein